MSTTHTAIDDLYWFDGFLLDVKLSAESTGGRVSVCEQHHPLGSEYGCQVLGPPVGAA